MSNDANQSDSAAKGNNSVQFVGFRLSGQHYVFPIEQIQEIVIPDKVAQTPGVADYVEGVSNLRGTIIPIINLRRLFALEESPVDDETRTIVVNVGTRTIGCIVDSVTRVVRLEPDRLQATPDLIMEQQTPWIVGFAKQDDEVLVVVDIDELLDPEKLEIVAAVSQQAMETGMPPEPES